MKGPRKSRRRRDKRRQTSWVENVKLDFDEARPSFLPDFYSEFSAVIQDNGELKPTVCIACGFDTMTYMVDTEGLQANGAVLAPSGNACMLSIIFPMTMATAIELCQRKEVPLQIHEPFIVVRCERRVTGISGETYGQFRIKSIPLEEEEVK